MAIFKDADEVYSTLGDFFERLLSDPELGPKMQALNMVIHIRYTDPQADLTIDATKQPAELRRGDEAPERFDSWMEMKADVGHRFWLGRTSIAVAMAKGQIKSKGNIASLMRLVPIMKPGFARYEQLLVERGRSDLLEAAT